MAEGRWVKVEFLGFLPEGVDLGGAKDMSDLLEIQGKLMQMFHFERLERMSAVPLKDG